MQMGPDSNIYVNGIARNYLGLIKDPDLIGSSIKYEDEAIKVINNGVSFENALGLQNLVVVPDPIPKLTQPFTKDTAICTSNTFLLDATTIDATYLWQDGSTDSTFNVSASGIYWVERDVNNCVIRRDSITVNEAPLPENTQFETICERDSILINDE